MPYKDLADRPLFITLLLVIFKRDGELPSQPNEVYGRIVDLLLREWDAERGVTRKSMYSGFDKRKKALFLAEMAFHLTCEARLKRFESKDLIKIYETICDNFKLPKDEADEVIREIESHTGIIIASGYKHYEFSHLSLQEFLCADYIVKTPLDHKLMDILTQHPDPAAVAIALSPTPSRWFTILILNAVLFKLDRIDIGALTSRLLIERPYFRPSKELGFALFALILKEVQLNSDRRINAYRKLFSIKEMIESIQLFLNYGEMNSMTKDTDSVRFVLYNPDESIPYNQTRTFAAEIENNDMRQLEIVLGLSKGALNNLATASDNAIDE
jgi:hypothetical protein